MKLKKEVDHGNMVGGGGVGGGTVLLGKSKRITVKAQDYRVQRIMILEQCKIITVKVQNYRVLKILNLLKMSLAADEDTPRLGKKTRVHLHGQ